MMNKEDLLTRMIRIYGFEHEVIIEFSEAMECLPFEVLEVIVKCHEENPVLDDEEE